MGMTMCPHIAHQRTDPFNILFNTARDITACGSIMGANNGQHIWKIYSLQTKEGARPIGPFFFQRQTVAAADINPIKTTC